MKSPVYGLKRGRIKRKRTYHAAAGGINMRGKKSRLMGCYCCECIDKRDQMLTKIHRKMIKDYK